MTKALKLKRATAPKRRMNVGRGRTMKQRIISTVKRIDKNEAEVVKEVRGAVSGTLRAGGTMAADTAGIVRDVVSGLVAAGSATGTGTILAAKAVAKGLILGVSDVGGDVVEAASHTARATMKAAAETGADAGNVAWGTVSGLMEAGAEVGASAAKLAEAGARGAMDAGADLGSTAAGAMQKVLLVLSQGIRDVVGAVIPLAEPRAAKSRAKKAVAMKRKAAPKRLSRPHGRGAASPSKPKSRS